MSSIRRKRNPNWRSRLPSGTQRAEWLRRCRAGALIAAAVFALAATAGYTLAGKAPALEYVRETTRSLKILPANDRERVQDPKWSFATKFYMIK